MRQVWKAGVSVYERPETEFDGLSLTSCVEIQCVAFVLQEIGGK